MRWLEVGAGNGRLTWHLRAALRKLDLRSEKRFPAVHLACSDSGLNGLHEGPACGCAGSGRAAACLEWFFHAVQGSCMRDRC